MKVFKLMCWNYAQKEDSRDSDVNTSWTIDNFSTESKALKALKDKVAKDEKDFDYKFTWKKNKKSASYEGYRKHDNGRFIIEYYIEEAKIK